MTQVDVARALKVSQPYLSQLEKGARLPSARLARRAAVLYKLSPTTLPLPAGIDIKELTADDLQRILAGLGYPGFEHVRGCAVRNPAEVVLGALLQADLDTRLVEALPWVLGKYTDLPWKWLRDRTKLHNAQNRLGYVVHLAKEIAFASAERGRVAILAEWEQELESARLACEGTLCRESMPERERSWLRANRPKTAAHWNLLTDLTADQLPYARN